MQIHPAHPKNVTYAFGSRMVCDNAGPPARLPFGIFTSSGDGPDGRPTKRTYKRALDHVAMQIAVPLALPALPDANPEPFWRGDYASIYCILAAMLVERDESYRLVPSAHS